MEIPSLERIRKYILENWVKEDFLPEDIVETVSKKAFQALKRAKEESGYPHNEEADLIFEQIAEDFGFTYDALKEIWNEA